MDNGKLISCRALKERGEVKTAINRERVTSGALGLHDHGRSCRRIFGSVIRVLSGVAVCPRVRAARIPGGATADTPDPKKLNQIWCLSAAAKTTNLKLQNFYVFVLNIRASKLLINNKDASNGRHIHGNNYISAAYYVRAPKNCGEIVFYDPRPAPVYSHPLSTKPNSLNAMVNAVNPVEGGLVLFPSYLDHSVNPNLSNEERIVISFNINLIKK